MSEKRLHGEREQSENEIGSRKKVAKSARKICIKEIFVFLVSQLPQHKVYWIVNLNITK
jgi:hypothetical protein